MPVSQARASAAFVLPSACGALAWGDSAGLPDELHVDENARL